jgi:hypothetical protein
MKPQRGNWKWYSSIKGFVAVVLDKVHSLHFLIKMSLSILHLVLTIAIALGHYSHAFPVLRDYDSALPEIIPMVQFFKRCN